MQTYPAKLLLFGEYLLLSGAPAVAMPVPVFGGQWAWRENSMAPDAHHERLAAFARSEELQSIAGLDAPAFQQDLDKGLYFNCNIPAGYGLGSSGALCAGVYDRYAREKTGDPLVLKQHFARMESFFHGRSSGLDPLTSYLGRPLLFEGGVHIEAIAKPHWANEPLVFLLDSKLPRHTAPLVQWFMQRRQEKDFELLLQTEWRPAHEATVHAWLKADAAAFWPALRRLSRFQRENLLPMIPHDMLTLWEKTVEKEEVALKLCGAGGGGFFLGFARNAAAAQAFSQECPFRLIYPFTPSQIPQSHAPAI